MTNFDFTPREYTEKLLEVIADRGDGYTGADRDPEGGVGCSYLPGLKGQEMVTGTVRSSDDRCLHGEALHRFGIPDSVLESAEGRPIDTILDSRMTGDLTRNWLEAMWVTQSRQDAGDAYSDLKPRLESLLETL